MKVLHLLSGAAATLALTAGAAHACDIDVTAHGATANGGADDTAAIQAAFDAALGQEAVICLPAGAYDISGTLSLARGSVGGLHIQGNGAMLVANGDFPLLSTGNWIDPGPADALSVADLNLVTSGGAADALYVTARDAAAPAYAPSASPSTFADCSSAQPVERLPVTLSNVSIMGGSAGSAVHVGSLIDLVASGVDVSGAFGQSLRTSGSRNDVRVSPDPNSGVGLSDTGSAYGVFIGARRSCLDLDQIDSAGGFQVAFGDGAFLEGYGLSFAAAPFYLHARESKVDIDRSAFATGGPNASGLLYMPRDVKFTSSFFTSAAGTVSSLRILWHAGGAVPTGQRVTCDDCRFEGESAQHAIYVQPGAAADDNVLSVTGGHALANHTRSLYLPQGGAVDVDGFTVPADSIFLHETAAYPCDVELVGVPFDPAMNCAPGSACQPGAGLGACEPVVAAGAGGQQGGGGGQPDPAICTPACGHAPHNAWYYPYICSPGRPDQPGWGCAGVPEPAQWACEVGAQNPVCWQNDDQPCHANTAGTTCIAEVVGGSYDCNHCLVPGSY